MGLDLKERARKLLTRRRDVKDNKSTSRIEFPERERAQKLDVQTKPSLFLSTGEVDGRDDIPKANCDTIPKVEGGAIPKGKTHPTTNADGDALPSTSPAPQQNQGSETHSKPPSTHYTSLWESAYNELHDEEAKLIKDYEAILAKRTQTSVDLPTREKTSAIIEKELNAVTNRSWKLDVPWARASDIIEKIIAVMLKFKDFGNVVGTIDPLHAGIPIAGVSLVLSVRLPNPLLSAVTYHRLTTPTARHE